MTEHKRMRLAALALLLGLACSLLWGIWSLRRQEALAAEVIRLHVIAASDSAEDQALKRQVRDAVLEEAAPLLVGAVQRTEAERVLRAHLSVLQERAQETVVAAAHSDAVQVFLTEERYPTRDYGTFSLPGGTYLSLRVVIGAGAGHNWWCVVFPPLCAASSVTELEESGLSEEDVALITQSDAEYVLKFKSIELWESWCSAWQARKEN